MGFLSGRSAHVVLPADAPIRTHPPTLCTCALQPWTTTGGEQLMMIGDTTVGKTSL
eukprot:CAMPEP_0185185796 /NCGR_PEP_ID=MMETSP1140-20130426/3566_1 /TAXON_ID=298111 /ORGANISM="Pavlova sp., Strain CCMP459" /LENGTH=55 /DNA_ID=CAMNT_0027752017 /DNA_START=54 /DNA_END=217 /DNA_ORIENTATION=+